MKKIIFFDIDGTLIDFDGTMPRSTKEALCRTKEKGNKIVICSGRTKFQIQPQLFELPFDGIVAATGAYVEYKNKVIYKNCLKKQALLQAKTISEEAQAMCSLQTSEYMVSTKWGKEQIFKSILEAGFDRKGLEAIWGDSVIDEHWEERNDIQKLLYYNAKWPFEKIKEALSDYFDVTVSSFEKDKSSSGELTCRGINKAFGMQKMIEYLGASKEDTIAFGDGPNDFDMIEYAHIGIVMGNGRMELKEIADYVTTDLTEDGIANAMVRFGLI